MSLHQLANHMSARGRGPDSTLVHMTPREVEGLQKLAVANGTSLTINPDTGLPEAFSLKDLLPTLAGAAINYFAPGFGTAIGGALGLSGAAGTGLAVGAATAAISGDLGKGLQAGLGAYGGAGITEGLMGLGTGSLSAEAGAAATQAGNLSALEADQLAQNAVGSKLASSGKFDILSAGASKAMSDPMSAVKAIGGGSTGKGLATLAGALSPLLAGETGNTVQTVTPRRPSTPISNEKFDPYSQTFERNQPRSNDGYDPYAQLYSRSAAKGGLMSLANGGITLDQMYQNVLGREADTGGKAFWASQFGDEVDANELASFKTSALGGTDTADKAAAQNFGISNAGAGFAAAAPVATQATLAAPAAQVAQAAPAARVVETAPLAAAQVLPQAGAGIAALSNAQATPAAPVTETAPAPVAQVLPQAQQFTPPDFFDTSQAAQDVRRTFADQFVKDNANNAALVAAQGLYGSVLDRKAESPEVLQNWATKFGATIDDSERDIFRAAAVPETSTRANQQNYIPISGLNALYQSELGRPGTADPVGMAFWQKTFGDYIDPTELAGFKEHAARERAARPVVVNPVVQNPAVVTDLTTAGTQYIAPGVGGSSGAGQIGGGTTINPNGTITTSAVIPGIPVGGFKGMTGVQKAYTDGGGSLGYTPKFIPTTTAEFDAKYSNTGYQKKMYDYLRGKGPKPTKMTDVDATGKETYREIMRPYKEAVMGVPVRTNTKLNWNKDTGEYERNRDYVRQKTITDPVTKEKSVRNYMSINNATAALTDKPYTIKELMSWADRSFVDDETLSQATGLKLSELQNLRNDADEVGATPEKKVWVKSKPAAKGGLMSLANGGAVRRFNGMSGSAVEGEHIDATTGDKYILDNRYGGRYRKEKVTKDGLNYVWDKVSNSYKLAGADSGIAGLLDMSGNGPPAGGENAPNTTPNYGVLANIGKSLSDMGLETFGGFLSQQAREGRTGQQGIPTDIQDSSRDDTRGPVDRNAMDAPNPAEGGPAPAAPTSDISDPTGADVAPADFAANGGMMGYYAQGGLGSLGGYSDGGRLLRGPGDGVSDSIPASIGDRQPARLADGEFVVPARIVSELGNGSTEAGARALYKMMDRIQANRRKTTGKNSVAVDSKAHKYLPA